MPENEPNKEIDAYITKTITDEDLRRRIRKIIDEPKPAAWWKRIWTNQLFLLVVGILLTGSIGSYLTYYYSNKQAELQRERSFADELNKTKVSKIAEVWEKVYAYEAAMDGMMQGVSVKVISSNTNSGVIKLPAGKEFKKDLEQNKNLHKELLDLLIKDRVWIDDDAYDKIKGYADTLFECYFAAKSEQDIKGCQEKKAQARVTLNEIREKMLKIIIR